MHVITYVNLLTSQHTGMFTKKINALNERTFREDEILKRF